MLPTPRLRLAGLLFSAALLGPDAASMASAGEPSARYRAQLQSTIEMRRRRRREGVARPVGTIVPFPMPASLIIRQTPEVHDEVGNLLRLLRH